MRDAALKILDERQAEEIVSFDLAGRSSVADYLIVASGRAARQLAAIAHYLEDAFAKLGGARTRVEGLPEANWVLVDGGDVIVHLFLPEVRGYYNLEDIWGKKNRGENMTAWDAETYARQFGFVPAYGRDLIGILAPQAGEKILDLGCGTGLLTAELAASGAQVTGIDGDPNMVALAQKTYPALRFIRQNAEQLTITEEFDAVFSNAALHWMAIDKVFPQIARVLRQGGRFVAELGGHHNIALIEAAIDSALNSLGHKSSPCPPPWRFPTLAVLAGELEKAGFEVLYSHLYDRPTPLAHEAGGLGGWLRMFGRSYMDRLPEEQRELFLKLVENAARPVLFKDGQWLADYRRQHFVAVRL